MNWSTGAHFGNALGGSTDELRLGTGLFITYSTVLSPNLIMSAGFGGMGEINNGFNSFMGVNLGSVVDGTVLPTISFNQNGLPNAPTTWGNSTASSTIAVNRKLGLSFNNNWLWTIGRHTLNIGWELRRAAAPLPSATVRPPIQTISATPAMPSPTSSLETPTPATADSPRRTSCVTSMSAPIFRTISSSHRS